MNNLTRSLVDQANEEKLSFVQSHPYYGLRDSNHWLTRYPVEDKEYGRSLKWTRAEVRAFVSNGGSFDSYSHWGPSPYNRYFLDSGMSASKLGEYCSTHAFYYIPIYRGDFPINDSLSIEDYLLLSKGAEKRRQLSSWGIKFTGSLFGLAYKSQAWMNRKIQRELSYGKALSILRSKDLNDLNVYSDNILELEYTDPLLDGAGYELIRKCVTKFKNRTKNIPFHYEKYRHRLTTKKGHELYMKHRSDNTIYNEIIMDRYVKNFTYQYTSLGQTYVFKDLMYVENVKVNVKSWRGYYVAFHKGVYFVWEPGHFDKHVEDSSLKIAVEGIERKLYGSKAKEKFFADHIISLRVFVALTSSCFAGTKNFLSSNAKHLHNLLSPYSNWEDVPSEIMDIEWSLTADFAQSFRYRF